MTTPIRKTRVHCRSCKTLTPAPQTVNLEALAKTPCPVCGMAELELIEGQGGKIQVLARACKGCDTLIPSKRLAAVPEAEYCVSCQTKHQRHEPLPKLATPSCPKCGAPMTQRQRKRAGVTDYFWGCVNFATGCHGSYGSHSESEAPKADLASLLAGTPEPQTKFSARALKIREKHSNAYSPWTKIEETLLETEYKAGKKISAIAKVMNRQPGAIRSRLGKMGLRN